MNKFDRIYALHSYIRQRRIPATLHEICEKLECSAATAKRIIGYYRDFLNAPLIYDRSGSGYRLDDTESHRYELPGLWFNDSELFALLLSYRLLSDIQPGLLQEQIQPVRQRIEDMLLNKKLGGGELDQRIRILQIASRPTDMKHFRKITSAIVRKKRLKILYHGRQRDKTTERVISAQRIVYYRDNWYLDAWCHLREDLRIFSIDRIHPVCTLEEPWKEMRLEELDAKVTGSYGIFSGPARAIAILRFTPEAAKWIADEDWHPEQKIRTFRDGSLELQIPYNNPEELIRDILKHGSDVQVIKPSRLRKKVKAILQKACEQY